MNCLNMFPRERRTLAFALVLLVQCLAWAAIAEGAAPFRFEETDKNSLTIWEGDKPVLGYNHGNITNAAVPKAQAHSAYIHPIYGMDGEVLTGDFPADHVYHRGLYWAWSHIKIDEKEYDLWSLRGIRIGFERWLTREARSAAEFGV